MRNGRGRGARSVGGHAGTETRSPASGWAIAAVLAVVAVLLYSIRIALLPFVAAVTVGFVVDPLIVLLQRRLGWPRWPVATLLYLVLLILLAAAGYWIGGLAIADMFHLAAEAPQLVHQLILKLVGPHGIRWFGHTYTPSEIETALADAARRFLGPDFVAIVGGEGVTVIAGVFLTLVLTLYLMISGRRLAAGAIWLIPPERRHSVQVLLPKIVPALRRYMLGLVGVVSYTAAAAYIGFGLVFALPHAILLAIAVGFLELVPVIGPLGSGALVGSVALHQKNLLAAGLLVGYAVALRLSIDNVVGPIVLGQAAKLHPVVVIFAFLCGAMLFGVIGLLLAVPAAACIKIVLEHYYAEPMADDRGG